MALPENEQECDADFVHYPASDLPVFERDGVRVTVIIGEAFGQASPVAVRVPMLYLELRMPAGSSIEIPVDYEERAAYVVEGDVRIDDATFDAGTYALSETGPVGGAHMGKLHIWWNFVSTSKDRIEKAKQDWEAKRFGEIPGETEFIPLPD